MSARGDVRSREGAGIDGGGCVVDGVWGYDIRLIVVCWRYWPATQEIRGSGFGSLGGAVVPCKHVPGLADEGLVEEVGSCVPDAEDVVDESTSSSVLSIVFVIQTHHLQSASQCFISCFLLSPPIQLIRIPNLIRPRLRNIHIRNAIILHLLIIKPWTITSLPLHSTNHTELCHTTTRHVITAFLQLNHRAAIMATLPSLFLGDLDKSSRSGVFRTFFVARVVSAITCNANFRSTAFAFSEFPAGVVGVRVDVGGFDPFPAAAAGAVETVLGGVFLVFAVPFVFELVVEKLVDVAEGDVFVCAAAGGHVGRVGDGHCEDSL
jgi:hypothetical protein